MESGPIWVAVLVVAAIAGLLAVRLRRATRRAGLGNETLPDPDAAPTLSTADQRFRLLSFPGGSVPADLGPVLEELHRNGIRIDEATLRRRLAEDGPAAVEGLADAGPAVDPADGTVDASGDPGTADASGHPRPADATVDASGDPDAPPPRRTPGTAIVLDAIDVGGGTAGAMRVQLILELSIAGSEPIREQRIATVAPDKRTLLVAGAAVPVRYEPSGPPRMTLEWELP